MLIWVIAYVNAQLGSSQCQNTSARVSECHPTLAPARRVDTSDKTHPTVGFPQTGGGGLGGCDHQWCQYQTFHQSQWTTVSACNAASHTCHQNEFLEGFKSLIHPNYIKRYPKHYPNSYMALFNTDSVTTVVLHVIISMCSQEILSNLLH